VIQLPTINYAAIGTELIVTVTALLILLLEVVVKPRHKHVLAGFALAGLACAFVYSAGLWGESVLAFHNTVALDRYSVFFKFIFLLATALTILLSTHYIEREEINHGEYYALLLLSSVGMMFMAAGTDLMTILLGLETMSISVYILAGLARFNLRSNEAALKYFLLGAFSTGIFVYGIALTYAATTTTNLRDIFLILTGPGELKIPLLLYVGMGLLLVGFGFKVAAVPFNMWAPDVYEGAPTTVTAFMSVGVKAAAFAAFVRVFIGTLGGLHADWGAILWVLAVLTMTVGNVIAIAQTNIKRMLAYSSIAHAGYILVALVAANELGSSGILFYLFAYTFMNVGAFGIVIILGRKGEKNLNLDDYAGLAYKYPLLGVSMAIFMLSLAGIPPTAGFVGKFYIFAAAVKSGYVGLAVIGVLNSAVSVYYYLRITGIMYMREEPAEVARVYESTPALLAVLVSVIGTLGIGIFPSRLLEMARQSVQLLLG